MHLPAAPSEMQFNFMSSIAWSGNRSASIHNHFRDSVQPFIKPLVLSFSASATPFLLAGSEPLRKVR